MLPRFIFFQCLGWQEKQSSSCCWLANAELNSYSLDLNRLESSHLEVFCEKDVLKNFTIFTGKLLFWIIAKFLTLPVLSLFENRTAWANRQELTQTVISQEIIEEMF